MSLKFGDFGLAVLLLASFGSAQTQPKTIRNSSSVELSLEAPLADVLSSRYFKLIPSKDVEIKDLQGFVKIQNESETIRCVFQKDRIPEKVKLVLARRSVWENTSGPIKPARSFSSEEVVEFPPQELGLTFRKASDHLDLRCEFTEKVSGYLEGAKEEENQRLQCESKKGIFTRYAKKEYDYICDYRLKYGDLKKVFQKSGLQFEVRNEPLQVAVVILSEDKPKKKIKKPARVPSSVKKRSP